MDGRSRRQPPTMDKHLVDYHLRLRVESTLFFTPVFKTGRIMVYHCPSVCPFHMSRSNLEPLGQFTSNFTEVSACPFTLCRGFFTPKFVGTFYMQGYKVEEKTAIVPHSAALNPQFQNSVGTLCLGPLVLLLSKMF